MRIARVSHDDQTIVGVASDDVIADLTDHYPDATSIMVKASDADGRRELADLAASAPTIPMRDCRFVPPIDAPRRILCVGTNYAAHVAESDRVTERPDHPMIFTRFASSLVGHDEAIERPPESTAFDYEGELAVVIGRTTRRESKATALDAIGGYSCFLDGTVRDWQRHTSQFTPGKNFERSGSWGPWIVTADEIRDPYELHLTTTVGGEVVQDAPTSNLIFDIGEIIEYCSTFTTLEPGDVIATGTPGGVGYARDPQLWLTPGTDVSVNITDVGDLRNTVVEEEV